MRWGSIKRGLLDCGLSFPFLFPKEHQHWNYFKPGMKKYLETAKKSCTNGLGQVDQL